jgi:hypothetical protein
MLLTLVICRGDKHECQKHLPVRPVLKVLHNHILDMIDCLLLAEVNGIVASGEGHPSSRCHIHLEYCWKTQNKVVVHAQRQRGKKQADVKGGATAQI